MAVTQSSQGSPRQFKNRVQFFNRNTATDKAKWEGLFAVSYDLNARKWRAGHEILDALTGLRPMVATVQGALGWGGKAIALKAASGDVVKNRLVEFTGASGAVMCTAPEQTFQGVALNDAADGERLYVQVLGRALVEASDTPPETWDSFGTDADGKASETESGVDTLGIVTQEGLTIGGLPFVVVTLSGNVAGANQAEDADATVSAIGTITITTPTAGAVGT